MKSQSSKVNPYENTYESREVRLENSKRESSFERTDRIDKIFLFMTAGLFHIFVERTSRARKFRRKNGKELRENLIQASTAEDRRVYKFKVD